jgi:hypothetical protein
MAYSFDAATGTYRDAAGALVPEARLRAALTTLIEHGQARIAVVSQRLAEGHLDRLAWRTAMQTEIRQVAAASAMLAHGGRVQMDASARGWLGSQVKTQYDYLSGFALDLAQGLPLDGRFLARAQLYAESGHGVYEAMRRRDAAGRGMQEERNVLGGSQHCPGCQTATAQDWVPLGTLTPPGGRDCVSRCRCHLTYRVRAEVAA